MAQEVQVRLIDQEMKESYIDYAMSVITARALPDVYDGLKPVHRRILYTMHEMGLTHTKPTIKSARIVGTCMGQYHPHGNLAVYDSLVRMAQDFSLRYPLVKGQGNFGCFTGDTKIKLLDGTSKSFKELCELYKKGEEFYVYSMNKEGKIVVGEAKNPRLTRKKAQIIEITLDTGDRIRCTPNHKFLLKDLTYKEAKDLTPTDSLMPGVFKLSPMRGNTELKDYLMIKDNNTERYKFVHEIVDAYNLLTGRYEIKQGPVRHHVDFNKFNNNPRNIQRVSWKEHTEIHSDHIKKLWTIPEFRKRQSEGVNIRRLKVDPAYMNELAQKAAIIHKKNWKEKNYKEKIIKNKILFYVNRLIHEMGEENINQEAYEANRTNNCFPHYSKAITYFENQTELIALAKEYNHFVVNTQYLKHTENVYDITVNEHHNFLLDCGVFVHNSIDGFSAAADRYTEAKLTNIAEEMLADLDKQTVPMGKNYDNSLEEPLLLPSKLPNLLVNGSSGIAVGMATNMPPHNITEVCSGIIATLEKPEITVQELMQHIKGPDFPTGATISGIEGLQQAYHTGKGKITITATAHVENDNLVITQIPYQVNKKQLIENIADLVREKVIEGIADIRDESDKEGLRIFIKLKKDAEAKIVLNQLHAHTALRTAYSIANIALHEGQPRLLSLKDLILCYVVHRRNVVRKRTEFDLTKAEGRQHIVEGLIIAINNIDPVIQLIKTAENLETARQGLVLTYPLTEKQADAILDMKLNKLTNLETTKLNEEHEELKQTIIHLTSILASAEKIDMIIKEELEHLIQDYGDPRKTAITQEQETAIHTADLIEHQDIVITLTQAGYIKQTPLSAYKEQRRGGIGVIGTETKEEDNVKELFVTHTKQTLLFFTNKGRVHWLSTWELPQGSRYSKGKAMVNVLHLSENEHVMTVLPVASFEGNQFVVMATKKGVVKKTALEQFSNPRRGGIVALTLDEGDELITTVLTSGQDILFLATKKGNAAKFSESDVRDMGRTAGGVIGIRLELNDEVVGLEKTPPHSTILTVTEKGFGKRTQEEEYRLIHRGGKGVTNIKVTEKNGNVVGVLCVKEQDSVVFITRQGVVLRSPVSGVNVIGRATQGLRLMRPREGDVVTSLAKVSAVDSPDTSMQPGT